MQLIKRAVIAATIVTSLGVVGASGTAMAGPCEARTTSAAFARWGDHNQYFVANGGTFEGGWSPWVTWGGAGVAPGQNSHAINGHGQRAMRLPSWSTAMSPTMCVFANEESLRFFYKAPASGRTMEVHIEVIGQDGYASTTSYVTSSSRRWEVSPIIEMPNVRGADGRQWVTIYLTPLGGRGSWMVDDVMIDPWVAR
jgi:hypothetical protein